MKDFINSNYMKWFRKRYLQYIWYKIDRSEEFFCCHVTCIHKLFICWKDLKEVKENMNSSFLYKNKSSFNCKNNWFTNKRNRLNFLQECLNKF